MTDHPEQTANFVLLSIEETAAVLAGLRLIQAKLQLGQFLPQGVLSIYDDYGNISYPLDDDGIDALCERINQ